MADVDVSSLVQILHDQVEFLLAWADVALDEHGQLHILLCLEPAAIVDDSLMHTLRSLRPLRLNRWILARSGQLQVPSSPGK